MEKETSVTNEIAEIAEKNIREKHKLLAFLIEARAELQLGANNAALANRCTKIIEEVLNS